MALEDKIFEIMKEYYPEIDCGPGTPFYEYVIRPMALLWVAHEGMYNELMAASNLMNYEMMTEEDMDRQMSRFFETRKRGDTVYAVLRLVFKTQQDYYVSTDDTFQLSGNRYYKVTTPIFIEATDLTKDDNNDYYADIDIVSDGTGNTYNAYTNESVTVTAAYKDYLRKSYILNDSTDGGVTETNADFYRRVSDSITMKNLTTYRGVRGTLFSLFNLREVTPIGLRDPEMRRDLVNVPGVGVVHRGSMADIYCNTGDFFIAEGYRVPLGFPYEVAGISIVSDPDNLMKTWNTLQLGAVDTGTRGSMKEVVSLLSPGSNMRTLTSNIQAVHNFVKSEYYEALHSDNLVKQPWPLVVRFTVTVTASTGTIVDDVKTAVVGYVQGLFKGEAPSVAGLVAHLHSQGIYSVHVQPHTALSMDCYYLTDDLKMEKVTLGRLRYPTSALLVPNEGDSLAFTTASPSQMSARTCAFYTNKDLVNVVII